MVAVAHKTDEHLPVLEAYIPLYDVLVWNPYQPPGVGGWYVDRRIVAHAGGVSVVAV